MAALGSGERTTGADGPIDGDPATASDDAGDGEVGGGATTEGDGDGPIDGETSTEGAAVGDGDAVGDGLGGGPPGPGPATRMTARIASPTRTPVRSPARIVSAVFMPREGTSTDGPDGSFSSR